MTDQKYVYKFKQNQADGTAAMRTLLGGKGANLQEMAGTIGLPVPPGFTIPTTVCDIYEQAGRKLPEDIKAQIRDGITFMEAALKDTGALFGNTDNPLLVSVRSGARESMPGMMDTILNLGLNDVIVEGLANKCGRRFAMDSYRRLLQMYADVVHHVAKETLDAPLNAAKKKAGARFDYELDAAALEQVVAELKVMFAKEVGHDFPQDPFDQLFEAVGAVFGSWNNARAIHYRNINGIPHHWGTATNVQAMVYGNYGDTSATGVAFTRDPSNGDARVFAEWLPNAQGEDVVSGVRTPGPLHEKDVNERNQEVGSLEKAMPAVYTQLCGYLDNLEKHFRDMQDVEFTIQEGTLYILQTRNGKRVAKAHVKIAVDLANEGMIDKKTAVLRVAPSKIEELMHPRLDPKDLKNHHHLATGLAASPGAATGTIICDADKAVQLANDGVKVILTRPDTSAEDVHGMNAATGILTATGGMTSHAAVVARGMGRPCVAGCAALDVDVKNGVVTISHRGQEDIVVREGDAITIDGTTGKVYQGAVKTIPAGNDEHLDTLLAWASEFNKLGVLANADTPVDAKIAIGFGADGIGLCRTEHMFFKAERVPIMQGMILSQDDEERAKRLAQLEVMQTEDFVEMFRALQGRQFTVRLLDPPLHEFVPHSDEDFEALAKELGSDVLKLKKTAADLHQVNPMLGVRGVRLTVIHPDITAMQARAFFAAAIKVKKEGIAIKPEIMVPFVMRHRELDTARAVVDKAAQEVFSATGDSCEYKVGTMIEIPRAALMAADIAEHADFFSFGTNDLTQMTLGLSRDDSGGFVPDYMAQGLISQDPFVRIDEDGVGKLIKMAVADGRSTRPKLHVGICGEQGGDPNSLAFFLAAGADYVSCSPFRIPAARLGAAQASLNM
eukprot:TRINITY_DN649_c0_g1_i1.p1 TRINITY_DN649_c0_g1~~TRINITY_DN649_c0_g1_i1.p1  ORF type:complete len:927 (+),score=307.38 TRINITY_DN649_c0_g1_i1:90-2783(+)